MSYDIDMNRRIRVMFSAILKATARVLLRRCPGATGFAERAVDFRIRRLPNRQVKIHKQHGFSPSTAKDLSQIVDLLRRQRGGRSTCNIVGSGPSALATLAEPVDPQVAYFTCNFGGLLPLPYDLYSLEVGTYHAARSEVSELQRKTIESLPHRPRLILAKNVWESKLEAEYVANSYPDSLICIDALFPFAWGLLENPSLQFIFDRFFMKDTKLLLQIHTSVLTLIQLAFRAGYTNIRVFGLDGEGPHFFHSGGFRNTSTAALDVTAYINPLRVGQEHKAGYRGRSLAEKMQPFLLEHGVRLDLVGLGVQSPPDVR